MHINTLQATLCGHNLPKPSGGEIFLNNVITSRCLIRPLNRTTIKAHSIQKTTQNNDRIISINKNEQLESVGGEK